MNLYKKIIKKLYYNAFPETREKDLFIKQVDRAKPKPRGAWIDVPKYKGFYVCSKCLERLDGDFERFEHWEMKKENFCPVCGSDNRKEPAP